MLFQSNRDGSEEIYTINPNGQGVDRLTNNTQLDGEPAWSPDGTKIAFDSHPEGNSDISEIYTMNSNGQGLDRLTNNLKADFGPDWQTLSPPDTTAPTVTSTVPTARAEGVATTVDITAAFSEDMMASTINESTFMLFKKGSTTKIAAALTYDAATKMATLNPTSALQAGVTYKAVLTTGAKDEAGNPLDQNTTNTGLQQKRWVFFTV